MNATTWPIKPCRPALLALAFMVLIPVSLALAEEPSTHANSPRPPCAGCHRDTTPGIYDAWDLSAHAMANVLCTDCHQSDTQVAHSARSPRTSVGSETCGPCHSGAFMGHKLGAHSRALDAPGARSRQCAQCHRVADRCDACHTRHSTDADISMKPATCGVCHNVDVPLTRIWKGSAHGALFAARGEPSCASCHMDGGSHNISRALASGRPAQVKEAERGEMVARCSECHTPSLARRALEDADRLQSQARAIMDEARKSLGRKASPAELPLHARASENIGGHSRMLASLASIETSYRAVALGAYHQNLGAAMKAMASLRAKLAKLKATAHMRGQMESLEQRMDNLASRTTSRPETSETPETGNEKLKHRLRALKDRLLSGKITDEGYQKQKDALLDEAGL